jgi:hypothetical protein
MRSSNNAAVDLKRPDPNLFPTDPPAGADVLVEEARLPYDLTGPPLSQALVRLAEHYGLPERPLVINRDDEDADGEYQLLTGSSWVRAAREAGLDRVPVRALEVSDVSAAFLGLVLNQGRAADVAAQADALQALLEAGCDEQDLARASGLGRARLRRLAGLLELHPVLRQGLRDGRVPPQAAFAAAGMSEATQAGLAAAYEAAGALTSADLRQAGGENIDTLPRPGVPANPDSRGGGVGGAPGEAGGGGTPGPSMEDPDPSSNGEDPAARARRQAEALLRTLEAASISADIRERVASVIDDLSRLALV